MRSLFRLAPLAVAAALALSGCSLEPLFHRPAAPVPGAWPTGSAYAKEDATSGPAAADIGWRDFLHDRRLQRIVELALQNNRDLRIALLNVEHVRDAYRIQHAAELPQVTLGAGENAGNHTSLVRYSTVFTASWEPDFFGKLHSLSHEALEQYLATREAARAAHIMLVGEVADQYVALEGADQQLAVTRDALKTAQDSFHIVDLQYKGGIASELDLRQAQTAVDLAQANEQSQLRDRAQAENALVLLVGQPLPADLPPAASFDDRSVLADIPAGLPSALLERRPDILEAEHVLRAETADIGAARAAFFPDLNLTIGAGVASESLSGLFSSGGLWSFAPSLVTPIFNGGALRASLDASKVQKDIGVAQYEKTIQTAFSQVADGLAARGTYTKQLAALQQDVDDQARRLELAEKLYADGIDQYLDVLSAQTDLYTARASLVTARQAGLTSLVDLYIALGGGWNEKTGTAPPAKG